MKLNILNRMMVAIVIGAVMLAPVSVPTKAQHQSKQNHEKKEDKKQKKAQQHQDKHQQDKNAHKQQQQDNRQQQQAEQQERARQAQIQKSRRQHRLSQQQQRERIDEHRQRLAQYREHMDQQQRLSQQRSELLRNQRCLAQYRFQQQYLQRLRQQQLRIQRTRNYNYYRDPYFYTPSSYRYSRGGRYYETNQYGANLLRQAVNYGYEEGFRAGQADRQDRWASNYEDSYAYQDANYGYSGYYVERDDYNHYFREGFRRGYEDGYDRRSQYGSYSRGKYAILGTVLSSILNLESLQ
jgi:hypothetical protein